MKFCEDCGYIKTAGICPYCQEELYILIVQCPGFEFSEEFLTKANEQAEQILKK